ncbi:MAG: nicotinate phosphoribosyltransferase [bacterium]|nr:nicotinate phosphoribosyltransferase [bacterium]
MRRYTSQPIIRSLLDLDLYKLTMLQLIWRRHRNARVTFAFKNRTADVRLSEWVDLAALQDELAAVRQLRFTEEDIAYLASLGMFDPEFLAWLPTLRLAPIEVHIDRETRQYRIETSGLWVETTLWETLVLAIVNELYYREVLMRSGMRLADVEREGSRRLDAKIALLHERNQELARHDVRDAVQIIEFGTRRRFSGTWQQTVTARMAQEFAGKGFLGTSNVYLAKLLGIAPKGTFAHELDMVYSGIYRDDLRGSHQHMLRDWWSEYGELLSIALTDTYTSTFFFEDFTAEQARLWRGLRQDSGNPLTFADAAIAFYIRCSVDPLLKAIVFSDGLTVARILELEAYCRGRIGRVFGWGTDLTNDLGFRALSLIMKAVMANGHGLVKLSDNLAKAQGNPQDVVLFQQTFGYQPTINEACVY